MKKEYIKPQMEVMKIQQQCQILAGSVQSANITGLEGFEGYDEGGEEPGNSW